MAKITLNDVGSLISSTTAVTTINDNSAAIEVAFENTLSRDGTTPNQMGADLDMNSHDILNVNEINTIDGSVWTQLPQSSEEGSIIYRGEKKWEVLNPGVNGQYLRTHGDDAPPSWDTASGTGDMLRAAYDPTDVNADIFNLENIRTYTRQEILTKNVPSSQNSLITSGYYVAGDEGSALYKRVVSEPSHAGKVQSLDGAWWELVPSKTGVSLNSFGAKGDWTPSAISPTDDAPALRNAVAYAVLKQVPILIPSAKYYINSTVSAAVVTVTDSSLHLIGQGCDIVYPSTIQGSVFVLGSGVADTSDFLVFNGSTTVRRSTLKGWGLIAESGVHATPIGRHGIFIDGTDDEYHLEYAEISDLFIDNLNGACIQTYAQATNTGGSLCYSTIRDCQLMQMSLMCVGDSNNIEHNVIGFNQNVGTVTGIYFYNVSGAANNRIVKNVIATQKGACLIHAGGTSLLIADNEFELSDVYANPAASIINIDGGVSKAFGTILRDNSISNNHVQDIVWNIVINNATGTQIVGGWSNIMSTQPAGRAHILVQSLAADTRIESGFYSVDTVSSLPVIVDGGTNTTIAQNRNGKSSVGPSTTVPGTFNVDGTVASKVYTVATLPTPTALGVRAFVSDSSVSTFTSAVSGGGGILVPVYWGGTSWLVG